VSGSARTARPAIGITISYDQKRPGFHLLREDYLRSVEQAGGLPLVLAPGRPEDAPELLQRVDGLLLTGGGDVDPALFGEERHRSVTSIVRERDDFEIALARKALERDLPLLAICRGQQVLNVAAGGTLVQDIPSQVAGGIDHDPERERWETTHDVAIVPGTRLRSILGRDTVAVNSFHHQSVKDVGRGLVVSARSPQDAVVEGLEAPDRRFAVAVQWHPESFWNQRDNFAALFESLVEAGAR
jgi:putative glutamine amidotransferase